MSGIEIVSRMQKIIVKPPSSVSVSLRGTNQQSINARPNASVSVINAGPVGPQGSQGTQGTQGIQGIQGIEGPAGSGIGGSFLYNQSIPTTTWMITHSLGFFPAVTIVDSSQREVVGDVTHIDSMSVQVDFSFPFSGKAYLS